MRRTPTAAAAAAVLGAVVLTACGSSTPDTAPAAQPLSTATETPSAPPSDTAPGAGSTGDPGDGEQQPFVPLDQAGEAPGSGEASITGVRLGEHEGYERVVLDLEGGPGEEAGWYATAVPQPMQDASGELLDVDGDRFVNLNVTGIANAADGRADSAGRAAFTGSVDGSGDLVRQVLVGGAWEGQAQVLLGLADGASEYRVLRLGDPQRIVVDVR